ncbi:hypothetical protein BDV95DRAFT_572111 [Massariosphaeria phaeospora]|uniref:FHA domain-containing protein n=1 Tax=Massariosphaeria phaeospora TaxID=100035 RepID=A0A7C8MKF3_9PLEO|nr:hypothetical protein BDV95DRAFT_572111 [Massariosphaeria phaeospora]
MAADGAAVEVVLRAIDHVDHFPERRFRLDPSVPIGRSSKNTSKRALMAATDNAFFDSPVISREHAVLEASTTTGLPQVFITDISSLHGTKVNSILLQAKMPHRLVSGDEVQFGVDVVRNDSQFIAKKYRFEAHLAQRSPQAELTHDYSVPDTVSAFDDVYDDSEAADEGFDASSPPPSSPHYGSQTNPVHIVDYEDLPPEVIDLDDSSVLDESTIMDLRSAGFSAAANGTNHVPTHDVEASTLTAPESPLPATRFSFAEEEDNVTDDGIEEEHFDNHVSVDHFFEEDVGDSVEDDTSEGDSVSDSEMDSASMSDSPESMAEVEPQLGPMAARRRLRLQAMLDHNHQMEAKLEHDHQMELDMGGKPSMPTAASHLQGSSAFPSPPSASSSNMQGPGSFFHASPTINLSPQETSVDAPATQFDVYTGPYSPTLWRNHSEMGPGAHERPAAPKPTPWTVPDWNESYSARGPVVAPSWFGGPPPTAWQNRLTVAQPPQPREYNATPQLSHIPQPPRTPPEGSSPVFGKVDDRVFAESVPLLAGSARAPSPPMPTPVNTTATPPLTGRRTKMSIPEIIEDLPQQPPTPTSMPNLKRKADVLEAEDAAAEEAPVVPIQEGDVAEAAKSVADIEQRPKKKLRKLVGTVAKTAGYAGAILSGGLAVLVSLPDSFFEF